MTSADTTSLGHQSARARAVQPWCHRRWRISSMVWMQIVAALQLLWNRQSTEPDRQIHDLRGEKGPDEEGESRSAECERTIPDATHAGER